MIKSVICRADFNGFLKICVLGTLYLAILCSHARAQVPFANVASRVSTLPEHLSQGMLASREAQTDEAPWTTLLPFAKPKSIAARHDGSPAGHADGVSYMGIGEFDALFAEAVEMWGFDLGLISTERFYITVAKVVSEYENNIRPLGRRKDGMKGKDEDERVTAKFHENNL